MNAYHVTYELFYTDFSAVKDAIVYARTKTSAALKLLACFEQQKILIYSVKLCPPCFSFYGSRIG